MYKVDIRRGIQILVREGIEEPEGPQPYGEAIVTDRGAGPCLFITPRKILPSPVA